jgi:hypothetical protein
MAATIAATAAMEVRILIVPTTMDIRIRGATGTHTKPAIRTEYELTQIATAAKIVLPTSMP